jgi:hypothetical protein
MVSDRKQAALDALDHLLGAPALLHSEKIEALREIEAAAKRMADGCERRLFEISSDR